MEGSEKKEVGQQRRLLMCVGEDREVRNDRPTRRFLFAHTVRSLEPGVHSMGTDAKKQVMREAAKSRRSVSRKRFCCEYERSQDLAD